MRPKYCLARQPYTIDVYGFNIKKINIDASINESLFKYFVIINV